MSSSEKSKLGEIVEREVRKLDEPLECSTECHERDVPWHEINCPANEQNRLRAMGLAVAKAVVALAADTIENGKVWYEHPDDCRTRCQHTLMEASKAIRALAEMEAGNG